MTIRRQLAPLTVELHGGIYFADATAIDVPAWMADGLCAQTDPESFFPEKGGSTREAKATCRRCPVTVQCLAYALDNGERYGIWGGRSERERRKLQPRKEPA